MAAAAVVLALGAASPRPAVGRATRSTRAGSGRRAEEPEAPESADLVVVAPHPDDAVLLAAGMLLRARQEGRRVAVIVMTNGDFECRVDGLLREGETVQGLAELGIGEDSVYFLGYPDGSLGRLGRTPLPPVLRRAGGPCERGDRTYGTRGRWRRDVHSARSGAPAAYTAEDAVADLAALLERFHPDELVVTHPNDIHPDHAATYTLVRRALDRLPFAPRLLRGLIHNGDCWPADPEAGGRCSPARLETETPVPPLTGTLAGYLPDERIPVPEACLEPSFDRNPKLRAIAAHHSQTRDDPGCYLFAFARADEAFFSEELARGSDGRYHPVSDDAAGGGRTSPRVLLRAQVPRPPESQSARGATNPEQFRTRDGGYVVAVDAVGGEASVWQASGSSPERVLHRWPLPHDSFAGGSERFKLELEDVAAGGGEELELYESGTLVGETIVPPPAAVARFH